MSTVSALVPAAISAIIGFGFAHVATKKIAVNTKAQKVFSYLLFISLGVGITGVLNELLISAFIGGGVRTDKVVMFTFSNIIVLPLIFLAVILFLKKSTGAASNLQESNNSSTTKSLSIDATGNHKIVFASLALLVVGILFGVFGKSMFVSDEFKFSSCTRCTHDSGCQAMNEMKGFKVFDKSIQIFMVDSNNMDRIFNLPVDEKMQCAIAKNRNYAFDCSSSDVSEYMSSNTVVAHDGKGKFIYNNLLLSARSRAIISDSKISCVVN